ncbi:PhoX family protein [Candidatus Manganitrophus noduliformans]|uniref:PhoX family phosphatase n=1 Tax=Candidatus Manganitrophus noduliformans TaxID=2606439 RepID=A0A7X6DTL9_9BACT|nr:PhoX family phosphatase [Candidatus Manganitrophus noduliformans]NKE72949.1 PhoX family phosphatase [Candidatus Manganitrophus noduliformans]
MSGHKGGKPSVPTTKNCDEGVSNRSGHRPFEEILKARISRRSVLTGGLALAATAFFGGVGAAQSFGLGGKPGGGGGGPLLGFTPVPVAGGGGIWPRISPEYQFQVLIPWGDPIVPGGPEFKWPPTSADQEQQIGIGHDGMTYFPIDRDDKDCDVEEDEDRDRFFPLSQGRPGRGNRLGMLAINLEFGINIHVFGKPMPESLEDVRVSQHAHGVAIVKIKKKNGAWQTVKSKNARRIHINTPMAFSGPAAGHPLLQTPNGNIPLGTANNCANGVTFWGTYLTCEENFNGYFGAANAWVPTPAQQRYGFSANGFDYGWHLFDRRFDLSDPDYTNEENRFGWVVEIDPMDATQKPVKRTALGRMKHEGATTVEGRGGRAVVYMGDDEAFDYIYKFVSDGNWKSMRALGKSPLDHGKLYVARFNEDGTGEWLELTIDNPALAAQFADQGEVLTFVRMAGDVLGATPMDRPEWITVGPNGDIFCTLTNNSSRATPNAPNPVAPNPDGHIIKITDGDKHVGLTFEWDIFLLAKDTRGTEHVFTDPDGVMADPDGRLFIQTDGGQPNGLNNQMVVADTRTGEIRRLFEGVAGDEVTGIAMTPDRRTMFVNIQHPGNGNPNVTNFPVNNPVPDGETVPRDATIVITRKDGGIIGS